MADKGYVGLDDEIRIVTPIKGSELNNEESSFNKKIGIDRVIIENYYGRLKLSWAIIRNKFRGSHGNYDAIFDICCGLTNVLIKYNPLKAEDGEYYKALVNELITKNVFAKDEKKRQE